MNQLKQSAIFQAMSQPEFYPHPVSGIDVRETHISKVFLTGQFVYKIKKAFNYEFLDFTTIEKRRYFCQQEISLNRRLAADVYIEVVPITRHKKKLYLKGPGKPVEFAVKMRQLPDDLSMLKLLRCRSLSPDEIKRLARRLALFYTSALTGPKIDEYGSIDTIGSNCDENFRQLAEGAAPLLDRHQFQIIQSATRSFLLRQNEIFGDRIKAGRIRDCHGDLRCGHIYFEDNIQIIDCIEFNDRFRYQDMACDLAYLIMDLEYEGFPTVADSLIEEYVRFSGDTQIYLVLDFFKCYRAMVKSKVCCFTLQGPASDGYLSKRAARDAQKYLALAYRYAIRFTRPTLWVICGLPASGKSTIAARLSAILHIDVLNSDKIRKQLCGLQPEFRADAAFEEGIYSPGMTSLTYGKMLLSAQEEIKKGRSIIIDATFSREHQRREALQLSRDMDANIHFIECTAPLKRLKARLRARDRGSSISDARIHHFKDMLGRFEPMDDIRQELHVCIHTEKPLEYSMQQILAHDYYLLSGLDNE